MAQYDAQIRVNTSVDTSQMKSLQLRIEKAEAATERFAKALDKARNTKFETQEYKDAQKVIAASEKELNRLIEKQDELSRKGREGGTAWNDLQYKIQEIKNQLLYAKSDAEDLVREGKAFYVDTAKVDDLSQKYAFAKRNAEILKQKQEEVNAKIRGAGSSSEDMATMFANMANRIKSAIKNIPAMIGQAFKAGANRAKEAIKSIGSAIIHPIKSMKQLGAAAKSAGRTIGSAFRGSMKVLGTVLRPIKSIKNALGKLGIQGKKSGSMFSAMGSRLKGIALSLLVFNWITKGFNAMVSSFKEGFQNIAKYSSETNKAMSDFKSQTAQLKNSLATAFTPIINSILPILTNMIAWMNKAADSVARFMALISGKKTYTKAKEQTVDYAKGLDKAGDSAKKAAKSLAAFDDLNILSDSSSDSGSDAGGAGDMFEEAEVGTMSDWAQSMKDAINKGDWYGVGSLLAEKINTALANVDFTAIDAKLQSIAKGIATGLNGFIEKLDWSLLGQTLGKGLNVAVNAAHTFLTTFNFSALGSGIANAINGFLEKTDWSKLGQTIGAGIQGAINFLYGFVTTLNWKQIGVAIYTTINNTLASIDFSKLGKTISTGIIGVLTSLQTALAGIDWSLLARSIENFLKGVDWSGIVKTLATLIGTAFGSLASLIGTFLSDAWDAVMRYFAGYVKKTGGNIGLGFLFGILDAFTNIRKWIVDNIFKPFIDGFKSAFDIHSPSKVMATMGGYLIDGLLNGITKTWKNITAFFGTAFTTLKESISGYLDSIKSKWDEKWNLIKTTITTLFGTGEGSIMGTISSAMSAVKSKIYNILNGKDGIVTLWESAWSSVKQATTDIFDSIWKKIKSILQSILNGIGGLVNKAIDTLNSLIDKLNGFSFDLPAIFGGGRVGFNIKRIDSVNIPQLADGAVIKGGNPFAAILGDQKMGQTNIETPLPTMIEAFKAAFREVGSTGQQATVILQVSEREFGRAVVKFGGKETQRIGTTLIT